jgi:Carboxypeptidase regulatory-like domain
LAKLETGEGGTMPFTSSRASTWTFGAFALFLAAATAALDGQTVTGEISGSVVDSSGAAVTGSAVTLTNDMSSQVRSVQTGASGDFTFPELIPGSWSLRIMKPGFKTYEEKAIQVSATERVALHQIQLELGNVNTTVEVQAESARVQTSSSERSGLITRIQVENTPNLTRNFLSQVALLPGVIDTAAATGGGSPVINGGRDGQAVVTLDGIVATDNGVQNTAPTFTPNLDAIGEMKALLSNYQAEYGVRAGGTIQVSIRSGSKELHGTAYYFGRNEYFNANDYFNNGSNLPRSRYRYENPGYTIGGPVLIPGLGFNRSRDRLFFFWSEEWLMNKNPSSLGRITFPTALERQGNFSQTFDTSRALISILDPLTHAPFPGNIVPPSQIDGQGQKLLSLFPLPQFSGATTGYSYNALTQTIADSKRRDDILRLDYTISPTNSFYIRLLNDNVVPHTTPTNGLAWPNLPSAITARSQGAVVTDTHIITPALINEITAGFNTNTQNTFPLNDTVLANNTRAVNGIALPQFFPQANPLNLVPTATYGGVSNGASFSEDTRYPFHGRQYDQNLTDNLSWVRGTHTFKTGIYFEEGLRNSAQNSIYNGSIVFSKDTNNPLDTNYAYSNAILGVIDSYTESNNKVDAHMRYRDVEWYLQDSWKAGKRLTIEVGIRFQRISPSYGKANTFSEFLPAQYAASKPAQLIQPVLVAGKRAGFDPTTGQNVAAPLIGAYGLNSVVYPGVASLFEHVFHQPSIGFGPRLGFAYDVFGNGKLAIRGGFGIFYDRPVGDDYFDAQIAQPPVLVTSTEYYSTIPQLFSSPLYASPANVQSTQQSFKMPQTYNYSIGIQRDLGHGLLFDVSYVGNVARHLRMQGDLNPVPYFYDFKPSSIDPTTGKTLSPNFLHPYYPGDASILWAQYNGNSNYNSLQTQMNRRFGRRLTMFGGFTWSKVLDYGIGGFGSNFWISGIAPRDQYGPATTNHKYSLTANFTYELPAASYVWRNAFTKTVFDGWRLAGLVTYFTGAPVAINTFTPLSGSTDISGGFTASGAAANTSALPNPLNVVCNADGVTATIRAQSHLNTACVQMPAAGALGGASSKSLFTGAGIENWNLSLFKVFRLGKDTRNLELRWETYNTFNHVNFTTIDTAARFNAAGAQTNPTFGQYTADAAPRRMVVAAKIRF